MAATKNVPARVEGEVGGGEQTRRPVDGWDGDAGREGSCEGCSRPRRDHILGRREVSSRAASGFHSL